MINSKNIEYMTQKYIDNGGVVHILEPETETTKYIINGTTELDYMDLQTIIELEENTSNNINEGRR